jgi:mono/diheme cytochrome c family protein
MKTFLMVCVVAAAASIVVVRAQSQPPTELSGNAQNGKSLFNSTYGCGSCHGVQGIAGTPRLVPTLRPQNAFITYVRKPTAATMPAFSDATDQQLADVYAYLKSIPTPNPPSIENFPILNDILKTIPAAPDK